MEVKKLLTKSLLVMAGLCVGANAWATDVPYNVGSSTSDAWGTAFSDVWTMTGDGAVTVTFTNYCATDGNWWDNWQLLCGNEDYTPAAREDANRYFQMRSDRWDDAANSNVGFIMSDDYFTDFKTFQNEATVTLKIARSGNTATVNVSVTKSETTRTMTFVKTGLEGTVNFFLTQSLSYMTITQQEQTTEMAGSVTANALINFEGNTGTGAKGSISVGNSNYDEENDPGVLYLRNGSGTLTIDASEYAGSKDIVTVSFDMMFTSMGKAKSAYFALQDKDATEIGGITFDAYSNTLSNNTLGLVTDDLKAGAWAHFTITLNYNDNSITTTTSCPGATNATSTHKVSMTNTNPFAKFYVGAGYNASYNYQKCRFDNLLIQTEKGDYSTTANITLAFEDNDEADISALYTGISAFTPEKGSTFTPSDYYPTAMYDEDYKYTYTSGGDAFTVTKDATVTLVYTKSARPIYTFNVTANYGGKNKKIVDGVSVKESADYTYYYPRFILDGTTLYEYASSTDENASASYWTSTHTNVAADGTYTLTYNAIEGNCVYYSEGEDVEDAVAYTAFKQYMSGGSSAVFDSGKTLTTLDAGVYEVTMRSLGRTTGDRHAYLYKGSESEENLIIHKVVSSNSGTDDSAIFSLDGSTDIVAKGGYSTTSTNGAGIDYVYIMKLPDNVSVSVSSAGWATLYTDYALNFSGTGLTAYTATCDGSTVTLTEVSNVPAGTGVVLKGDEGDYNIPVIASSETAKGSLAGNASAATAYDGVTGKTLYVLTTINEGAGVQFNPVTSGSIAAGKAYLPITSAGAKLRVVFAGDASGIEEIATEGAEDGVLYNVAGQVVTADYKGIVIKNGKKYLNK